MSLTDFLKWIRRAVGLSIDPKARSTVVPPSPATVRVVPLTSESGRSLSPRQRAEPATTRAFARGNNEFAMSIFSLLPEKGRNCNNIRAGYQKYGIGKHFIFYRVIRTPSH